MHCVFVCACIFVCVHVYVCLYTLNCIFFNIKTLKGGYHAKKVYLNHASNG